MVAAAVKQKEKKLKSNKITKEFLENTKLKAGPRLGKTYKEALNDSYNITKTGCWEWNRAISSTGYGSIVILGKSFLPHRIFYILHKGEIKNELDVCHKCDNIKCVNPDHLFLGIHKDNMMDMFKKGRSYNRDGYNNPNVKLTKDQVLQIRKEYSDKKINYLELCNKYKISVSMFYLIIKRKSWKNI